MKLHFDWLLASIVGREAFTAHEYSEIERFKAVEPVDLATKAYLLGRLKAVMDPKDWKALSYAELDEHKLVGLAEPDLAAFEQAKSRVVTYVKKILSSMETSILETLDMAAEQDAANIAVGKSGSSLEKAVKSLAKEVKANSKKNWELSTRTELHVAKTKGYAQAIVNKVGVYKASDGVDSEVSVVPQAGACKDCKHLYLDGSGNPKVFKLRKLLEVGSNADRDHTSKEGRHVNWKSTIPAAHPGCFCQLIYIPTGYGWVDGKLKLISLEALQKSILMKADSSAFTAVTKPQGPDSTAVATPVNKQDKVGSIPGIKAPQQKVKLGEPDSSNKKEFVDCPYGGGAACKAAGGKGAKTHEAGGSEMKAHEAAKAGGQVPTDPEAAAQMMQKQQQDAINWSLSKPSDAVKLGHLKDGEIVDKRKLEGGINAAHIAIIKDNGRAVMKEKVYFQPSVMEGRSSSPGCATVPHGTQPQREEAAGKLHALYGSKLCPTVTTREHEGLTHSMMHFVEGSQGVCEHKDSQGKIVPAYLNKIKATGGPEAFEKAKEQLFTMIALDVVMNSQDRHYGNLLTSEDGVHAIDNGMSFGTGLAGYRNYAHCELQKEGYKVKLPADLKERMSKTTYHDMKRSLGDHVEDWAVGQTFLRQQYLLHLEEQDGHLDYKKIHTDMAFTTDQGSGDFGFPENNKWTKLGDDDEEPGGYLSKFDNREYAFQQFENFCVTFIDEHRDNPESPHHEAAKELHEIGVIMPPGKAVVQHKTFRKENKHFEYEKKVRNHVAAKAAASKKKDALSTEDILASLKNMGKSTTGVESLFLQDPGLAFDSSRP